MRPSAWRTDGSRQNTPPQIRVKDSARPIAFCDRLTRGEVIEAFGGCFSGTTGCRQIRNKYAGDRKTISDRSHQNRQQLRAYRRGFFGIL